MAGPAGDAVLPPLAAAQLPGPGPFPADVVFIGFEKKIHRFSLPLSRRSL
jgi:hypothetical protein